MAAHGRRAPAAGRSLQAALMTESFGIHYRITPVDPNGHLFGVQLRIHGPAPEGQVISMPAWIPGSYMIRDFARNVGRLTAESVGRPVAVTKLDKQTWRCAPCEGMLLVRFQVYAWDLSVRAAHLDRGHGYFNPTSVFPRVHGRDQEPVRVDINPPPDQERMRWRVATSLPLLDAAEWGFGSYQAASYNDLIDHPVEMADWQMASFEACGVPHHVVLSGRHRADLSRLCNDLQRVCEYQIKLFGEPAPMQRYLFLNMVTGDGYGGLEHKASCSLICARGDLPVAAEQPVAAGYRNYLGLCSHEYFHSWNVKRITPAAFTPYRLEAEVHTRLLWAFEGITSYYDDLCLLRCGLIGTESYLELLGQMVTRVWRGSGRLQQTVAESSFDAWTKFYKQDENAPNSIVSYYAKGALVALALDLTLRLATGGQRSLDDVMRLLWRRYGMTGLGVPERGVERAAEEVAGTSLQGFFDLALDTTDDLPLPGLLAEFGVEFQLRAAEGQDDKGGKAATVAAPQPRAVLGVRSQAEEGGEKLTLVHAGSAAHAAGLSAGDLVVAVDGLRVTGGALEKCIGTYPVGSQVRVHAFRRDELMEFLVSLQAGPADTCVLSLSAHCEPDIRLRREAWLRP